MIMAVNSDVDEDVEDVEEEEVPRRRNPLRLILLVLLALVGICVLCFLAGPMLGSLPIPLPSLPGIPGLPTSGPTPAVPPAETPTTVPTQELPSPGETVSPTPGTEQPVSGTQEPGTEQPLPTQEVGTEQPLPTQEAGTEQPLPTQEAGTEQPTPTEPVVDEHGGEMPAEGTATATTVPVPGPTATPPLGGTVEPTAQADCTNNQPPVAEAGGPYNAMMGKGQAIVVVDGSASRDSDGTITSYEWDFGDGSTDSGQKVTYGYSSTGVFTTTLTVTDNCDTTATDEAQVTIVGPTPPASTTTPTPNPTGEATATPIVSQPPDSDNGTAGFCYRVQPGNTLSGIAWYFGVPLPDLAAVNGVSAEYFVIAGQGLFIPVMPPQSGPNVYEAEPGDTFYSIAFQCGVPAATLADANGMTPDEGLTPGQMVVIPPWGWY
jgi:LysM repeat protein